MERLQRALAAILDLAERRHVGGTDDERLILIALLAKDGLAEPVKVQEWTGE